MRVLTSVQEYKFIKKWGGTKYAVFNATTGEVVAWPTARSFYYCIKSYLNTIDKNDEIVITKGAAMLMKYRKVVL